MPHSDQDARSNHRRLGESPARQHDNEADEDKSVDEENAPRAQGDSRGEALAVGTACVPESRPMKSMHMHRAELDTQPPQVLCTVGRRYKLLLSHFGKQKPHASPGIPTGRIPPRRL